MPHFLYKGHKIHYAAEGEGPALVLLHGLGGSANNWLNQRIYFRSRCRVIAPDLPGHGQSEGSRIPFAEYHLLLKQLLAEELKVEAATVCGISMGGRVAIDLAYHHPGLVQGLVLADTFAAMEGEDAKEREKIFALLEEENGAEKWVDRIIGAMGLDPGGRIAKGFRNGMRANDLDLIKRLFIHLQRYDQRSLLPAIAVPVLIIHGERDRFVPLEYAEELHRRLVRSTLVLIPDSGHLPNVEQPGQFNRCLEEFLDLHRPPFRPSSQSIST